jgi:hypothetical protein
LGEIPRALGLIKNDNPLSRRSRLSSIVCQKSVHVLKQGLRFVPRLPERRSTLSALGVVARPQLQINTYLVAG